MNFTKPAIGLCIVLGGGAWLGWCDTVFGAGAPRLEATYVPRSPSDLTYQLPPDIAKLHGVDPPMYGPVLPKNTEVEIIGQHGGEYQFRSHTAQCLDAKFQSYPCPGDNFEGWARKEGFVPHFAADSKIPDPTTEPGFGKNVLDAMAQSRRNLDAALSERSKPSYPSPLILGVLIAVSGLGSIGAIGMLWPGPSARGNIAILRDREARVTTRAKVLAKTAAAITVMLFAVWPYGIAIEGNFVAGFGAAIVAVIGLIWFCDGMRTLLRLNRHQTEMNKQDAEAEAAATATRLALERQKSHGDARLATEAEATAAATGGVRKSSVHDQEF